ncbi:MAG: FixH family protein [Sphingomonadaceae bacterium]|nr:FixH family protein [Sphingomonadaceae bacterium]
MTEHSDRTQPFTGKRMAAILIGFFGVVIAVNLTMATLASSTFGGIVVPNSYIASQNFNDWLDEAQSQRALGWEASLKKLPDGTLAVRLAGPGPAAQLAATARHPLGRMPDRSLHFHRTSEGAFISNEKLPAGRWTVRLEMVDGDTTWRQEHPLQ